MKTLAAPEGILYRAPDYTLDEFQTFGELLHHDDEDGYLMKLINYLLQYQCEMYEY